ncbi:putative heme degradation protein [Prosthecobacter fusiformis]|uniref:Putative heme degradation protein n=1 Tax=Prosthecobacter fusiformis TaxID=48464 RepID=A0A4R7SRC2_9BACT|nr:ChuX/HutX family heme-like substrate-binding protein [Prosthecobacter fusiformis]TDU81149.1 putative heme degradation protein [Prosthecobacter fusiformis]
MDSTSRHSPRIAYSFPAQTFDLRRVRPEWCFEADGGAAMAIHLDGNWPRFFKHLRELGLVMATAARGPVSMATAWEKPLFQAYPGGDEWLCLDSGAEIRPSAFGGAMAVVEDAGGQQVASFQFFDRSGEGCLKILVTNWSDYEVYEDLVSRHASGRRTIQFGQKAETSPEMPAPDTATVRQLWNGLSRSLPDTVFPGLEGVSRLSALAAVGQDLAWRLPRRVVRQALQSMTLAQVPLGGAVRNEAVFMPTGFFPTHWGDCGCGTTFFGEASQLTLRGSRHRGQAWATRFLLGGEEIICIEMFNIRGEFAGGVGLRPESSRRHRDQWNELLKSAS